MAKVWLGRPSLGCAIFGFVFNECILGFLFANAISLQFNTVLFVILELIALGLGIAAIRTATGIAGLIISGFLLSFLFIFSFGVHHVK